MTSPIETNPNLLGEERRHLVMINGDVVGIVLTEEEAIRHTTRLAAEKERSIRDKVFRVYINDGREIQLYTENRGLLFRGEPTLHFTISTRPVGQIKSPYADKIQQFKLERTKK